MVLNAERVTLDEFEGLFDECSNWGRWGSSDDRGTLNTIRPEHVSDAAALVRLGVSVPCGRTVDKEPAIDIARPAAHHMTKLPAEYIDGYMGASCDYLGAECHGEVLSHIDALCHISYKGKLYNDRDVSTVTSRGAQHGGLETMSAGITGRGVLLDIAAVHGVDWLEPGTLVGEHDLDTAAAGVDVGPGDIVLIRTGHATRRRTQGPFDSAHEKAGLHPRAMKWFKDRDVAALGFDGDGDAAPHAVAELKCPIHILGIAAMGMPFMDALDLDALAAQCRESNRWVFMFTLSPIPVEGATGCLVNPLAIF